MPDIYVTLNARLRPLDRGDVFEDPLMEALEVRLPGVEVTGGGTLLSETKEPSQSDIDLAVEGDADQALRLVIEILESLGAPVGSKARIQDGEDVSFGTTEGLGLYLNGTDLPDETYEQYDINDLIAQLQERLGDEGDMFSYWEGPTETALYLYGPSAARMRELMADVLDAHPLAQRCRLEPLATRSLGEREERAPASPAVASDGRFSRPPWRR